MESVSTYVFLVLFIILSIVACLNFTIANVGGRQTDRNNKMRVKKQSAKYRHILNELPAGCMLVKFHKSKPDNRDQCASNVDLE